MGGQASKAAAHGPSDFSEEDDREKPFAMWPDLEDQLEQSFICHDVNENDAVPYDVMEPVLRHHLMECGLIEYVTRFVTLEGALDTAVVAPYLKRKKINLSTPLSLGAWKGLVVSWIELVQDSQANDVRKWQQDLTCLQYQQAVDYKNSMELFQEHYVKALEENYKSIEAEHKQEQKEREEWERNQRLQEEFYNEQMGFCQKANDEALKAWQEAEASQKSALEQYIKWLAPSRKDHKTVTYSYQLPNDSIMGPISGGCRKPSARFARVPRQGQKGM